jgi:hypothetical protein
LKKPDADWMRSCYDGRNDVYARPFVQRVARWLLPRANRAGLLWHQVVHECGDLGQVSPPGERLAHLIQHLVLFVGWQFQR